MNAHKSTYAIFVLLTAAFVAPVYAQYSQQGNKLVGTGALSAAAGQGSSVALSRDGATAAVGANAENAVWIFTRSNGAWTQQGSKLSVTGCAGTPQELSPVVGCAVAFSSDGNTLMVGSRFDNGGVGSSSIFVRSSGTWSQQGGKLTGNDSVGASEQGFAVALSSDGNTALVGGAVDAQGLGAAWVYTRDNTGTWSQQGPKLVGTNYVGLSWQGNGVALSADGNTALIGGPFDSNNLGAAWVFTRTGATWTEQGGKLVGNGANSVYYGTYQGQSVALSSDGSTALIGGPTDGFYVGASWVFTRTGNSWTQQGGKLAASDSMGSPYQGQSVALSGDGNTAVIGGPGDGFGMGATWIYTRSNNTWTQQGAKLLGAGVVGGVSGQGQSVAISTDAGAVVAGGNTDASGMGAAWAFVQPHLGVSAPLNATVGVPFNFTVSALSAAGNNPVPSYSGTVHFTSSDTAAVLPADAPVTGGTGVFSATLMTTGNQTITAADSSKVFITGTSPAIAVSTTAAPAATHFSVSAPAAATAGTAFNFTVTAFDSSNHTVTGYTGTVHFTSTDSAAVLPANTTLTNGTGTFSATLKTAGSQTIAATDTVTASISGTSGSVTVAAVVATPPSPVAVTPATGFVSGQTLGFAFSDPRGTQDLGILNVLISNFLDGRNACYVAWDMPHNVLYLVADDGGTLLNVPASGTASNSQCTIGVAVVPIASAVNTVNLGLSITFKSAFGGNKVIYMAARDVSQNNSGWQAMGVVQVPGAAQTTTTSVVGMTNARGSGLGPTQYTFSFSDTKGVQDLGVQDILIDNFINGNQACYVAYSRPLNVLYLVNDAGTALSAGMSLASAGSVSNSQCTVSWGANPVATTGNNLSLTLTIQFTAAFTGNRVFYLATRDVNEANSTDWQAMGTWTVM